MLRYAVTFLAVAIVAGALGLSGVAQTIGSLVWILLLVSLGVAAILFALSRRARA